MDDPERRSISSTIRSINIGNRDRLLKEKEKKRKKILASFCRVIGGLSGKLLPRFLEPVGEPSISLSRVTKIIEDTEARVLERRRFIWTTAGRATILTYVRMFIRARLLVYFFTGARDVSREIWCTHTHKFSSFPRDSITMKRNFRSNVSLCKRESKKHF